MERICPLYMQAAKNATYSSDVVLGQMLQALAGHDETSGLLQQSTFVGVSVDETTDVSNVTQLDTYLRLLLKGRVVRLFPTQLLKLLLLPSHGGALTVVSTCEDYTLATLAQMRHQISLADILVWLLA